MAEDKARDRVESGDSGSERNAVSRPQGPDAARMDFSNGLLGINDGINDRVGHLRSRSCPTQVRRMVCRMDKRSIDGAVNGLRGGGGFRIVMAAAQPGQHHPRGEDLGYGVGDALPGYIGGGPWEGWKTP